MKNKNIFLTFFTAAVLCIAAAFCGGCAGRKTSNAAIDGQGSRAAADAPPFAPAYSIIYVPAEIKTSYIENALNSQLSGTLSRDTTTIAGITTVAMAVRRNGRVKITARGDELRYAIPLKIAINVSTTFGVLGINHVERQEAEAGLTLNLRSKIKLTNDWRLVTKTTTDGYKWTKDPVVKIRGVTIPVKPVADGFMNKNIGKLGQLLDKAIIGSINVKTMFAAQVWEQLRAPTQIKAQDIPIKQEIWLRLNPSDIYMSQLQGAGDVIKATVGARAIVETFIGTKPDELPKAPIPNFEPMNELDSSFTINLYSEISYIEATALSKDIIIGKTFKPKKGKQKITVHDIEVAPAENGMVALTMDISGSLKGTVCVTGRPKFDEATRTLSLEDLDFDAVTNSKFQQAKNWLLKGIIIAKMKPMMKFPMGDMLDETKILAGNMLGGLKLGEGITISGRVEDISVGGITTTETGIRVLVLARGVMGVGIAPR